jgi:catechol 2,3-dioxygenase-like lactoylglutathione lyase family enzyme
VLDHVILNVRDMAAARAFYDAALAPLGLGVVREFGTGCGYGTAGKPEFWVARRDDPSAAVHVAFSAPDRATVDAFYVAALAAGGRDNGAPGVRERYHSAYYAAFALDPDGNNIEAVTHRPE